MKIKCYGVPLPEIKTISLMVAIARNYSHIGEVAFDNKENYMSL